VSIAVNADSLATWLLPALTAVRHEPRLCFELRREDETRTASLLREGAVMAAVTSSSEPVTGCSVRALGRMRYVPAASPDFAREHLDGPLGEVLATAPTVAFDRSDDLQDAFVRRLRRGGGGASPVRHFVPTSEGFAESVTAGLGWGLVPEVQAEPLLRAGRLVHLDPRLSLDVPLYWQQWKLDSPALATVADAVTRAARRALRG
jgi:LysR family transcriptional regulator (chromosome initiation inhibitor)